MLEYLGAGVSVSKHTTISTVREEIPNTHSLPCECEWLKLYSSTQKTCSFKRRMSTR